MTVSRSTPECSLGLNLHPSDHHKRITIMHKENSVDITKATHAGRCYSAMNSRAHGATVGGTKALGGWNESGSFRNCYDRAFPVDALLGAASFNARKPEEYFLARDELGMSFILLPILAVLKTDFLSQNHPQTSSPIYFLGSKQSKLLSKFG
jgi:hypothetical protein